MRRVHARRARARSARGRRYGARAPRGRARRRRARGAHSRSRRAQRRGQQRGRHAGCCTRRGRAWRVPRTPDEGVQGTVPENCCGCTNPTTCVVSCLLQGRVLTVSARLAQRLAPARWAAGASPQPAADAAAAARRRAGATAAQ
jgi:hypothetical protein